MLGIGPIIGHGGHGRAASLAVAAAAGLLLADAATRMAQAASVGADAVVLVNSQSAKYQDFQRFLQPYLDNFGVPYRVQDISTNAPGPGIGNYAVIIIGHSQLDTNRTYLTAAVQTNLSAAVYGGSGLVNFDNDLSSGGTARYQFVQDVFGFSYGAGAAGSSASLPPTEPASQMHYITALHATNQVIGFRASITLPGITVPGTGTTLALSGGKPLVAVARYGQGRAVQWGSYAWMPTTVLGPLEGLDDLVWRGAVWAARKPFVIRGLPNLVVLRMDDCSGPFWWVRVANQMGFKPFVSFFLNSIDNTEAADLSSLVLSNKATASIHAFDCCSSFFYFNHAAGTAYSDSVMNNNYATATQWHTSHNVPISKVVAPHYSEIGLNAFTGLKNWGVEYVPMEVVPGTIEYASPGAPWLIGGPYRRYETPQPGQVNWPLWYADALSVPGHPELDGQFFNCYVEVRDDSSCNEWCPANNDVTGSIGRGVRQVKRELDSMALGQLYTHEFYLIPIPQSQNQTPITSNNWYTILQGITNGLGAYSPNYVTMDYACQYVRATRTSRLVASTYDSLSGQVSAVLTGKTDLATSVYVFTDLADAITSSLGTVPAFAGPVTNTVATLSGRPVAPSIIMPPSSVVTNAGATVAFSVTAFGTPPLYYQWLQNDAPVADGSNISGATAPTLTLTGVTGTNAGGYSVMVTNFLGSTTSLVAVLTVLAPPMITTQPQSLTNVAGTEAAFSVIATGTAPLACQWRFDGVDLASATDSNLTLSNVQAANAGSYALVVTNVAGSTTSLVAVLTVLVPPTITTQPQSLTNVAGTEAAFSVTATGTAPLAYQWQFDGVDVADATGASLAISDVQPANAGSYAVVVTNIAGSATSSVATLTLLLPPAVLSPLASLATNAGAAAVFTVTAAGTAPLSYQWLHNATPLADGGEVSGATAPTLTLASVLEADAGHYAVVITNPVGAVTSPAAMLTVVLPPRFMSVTLLPDGNPLLSLEAVSNLTYRIDAGTDLVNWASLTNLAATNRTLEFIDSGATGLLRRFYRAVWVP